MLRTESEYLHATDDGDIFKVSLVLDGKSIELVRGQSSGIRVLADLGGDGTFELIIGYDKRDGFDEERRVRVLKISEGKSHLLHDGIDVGF